MSRNLPMTVKRTLPASAMQQTLAYLFDERPHALTRPVEHWLATSKPFVAFVQTYQPKIRKKVRMGQDAEQLHSLYCELRTAYLLLQEPRFAVAYEPFPKQQGRSPDFAVTYRTHTTFHVEVTRLRPTSEEPISGATEAAEANDGPVDGTTASRRTVSRRLVDVICEKLGQLSPSTPNVLFVWVQNMDMLEMDIEQLLADLKGRAEQRDAALLARYGFRNPAEFVRHFQRLSVVMVQSLQASAAATSSRVWINRTARYPLPAKLISRLSTLVTKDPSQGFAAG
jgi:hypothetical protein